MTMVSIVEVMSPMHLNGRCKRGSGLHYRLKLAADGHINDLKRSSLRSSQIPLVDSTTGTKKLHAHQS